MDEARRDFLAAARLSRDVDRRLRSRELLDHLARPLDRRRFAEELRSRGSCLADRRAPRLHRPRQLQGAHHQRAQLVDLDRFREVIEGSRLQRRDRVLRRPVGGDDRDRRVAVALGDLAQHREPVAVGKPHVGERQIVAALAQRALRLLHGRGGVGVHAHARQRKHEELADVGLVVDDEDGAASRHHAAFTVMRKCAPPEPSMYSRSSRAM